MVAVSRLSSKGQIVIPKEVRRVMGLVSGDLFLVEVEGDRIILRRIEPIDRFRGILKEPVSDREIEEGYEEAVARGEF